MGRPAPRRALLRGHAQRMRADGAAAERPPVRSNLLAQANLLLVWNTLRSTGLKLLPDARLLTPCCFLLPVQGRLQAADQHAPQHPPLPQSPARAASGHAGASRNCRRLPELPELDLRHTGLIELDFRHSELRSPQRMSALDCMQHEHSFNATVLGCLVPVSMHHRCPGPVSRHLHTVAHTMALQRCAVYNCCRSACSRTSRPPWTPSSRQPSRGASLTTALSRSRA